MGKGRDAHARGSVSRRAFIGRAVGFGGAALALAAVASACGAGAAAGDQGDAGGHATMAMATPTIGSAASARPAAAATATAPPADGPQIIIGNFAFTPPTLTIAVGTTVSWINHDDIPHTVTSSDRQGFASPALDTDDRFSYRFTAPGAYAYFCSLHPVMTGQIVVQRQQGGLP